MATGFWLLCLALSACHVSTYGAETSVGRDDLNYALRLKRQSEFPKRLICYYGSWSAQRDNPNRFTPEDIDPTLCTHILYGNARPDREEGVVPYDSKLDIEEKNWAKFVDVKKSNPNLKVMLVVGGLLEGSSRFSPIAADPKLRQIFATNAAQLIREQGFDGIDVSWYYPGFSEGSSSSDKENFVLLIKELRRELGRDLILSISVPPLDKLIDRGYNIPELDKQVDFMNVWAGAYHESTAPVVNHPSPLYAIPNDQANSIDGTIRSYLRRGVIPAKLNLVMAMYGLYYVLDDPNETDIGSRTDDEAENPEWRGALLYNELCLKIQREKWTVRRVNRTAVGPYAFKDKEWVGYDDEDMVRIKAEYANRMKLGGIGFWTIDQDDFKGRCHFVSFPLLKAGREVFINAPALPAPINPQVGYGFIQSTTPFTSHNQ